MMPTQPNMIETDISAIEICMLNTIESFRPFANTVTWFFDDHGGHWVKFVPVYVLGKEGGWLPIYHPGQKRTTYSFPADEVVRVEHNNDELDNSTMLAGPPAPAAHGQPAESGLPQEIDTAQEIYSGAKDLLESVSEFADTATLKLKPGWRYRNGELVYSSAWL